jgi:hypothetical protein
MEENCPDKMSELANKNKEHHNVIKSIMNSDTADGHSKHKSMKSNPLVPEMPRPLNNINLHEIQHSMNHTVTGITNVRHQGLSYHTATWVLHSYRA